MKSMPCWALILLAAVLGTSCSGRGKGAVQNPSAAAASQSEASADAGRASPPAATSSPAAGRDPLSKSIVASRAARAELSSAARGGASRLSPSTLADRLDMIDAELQQTSARLQRDTFDPAAVVARVGRDPGKLLAWVQKETALVPYQGELRGPVGVLMDRKGNSLDRSLLLAELLQRSGAKVRLARATLSADRTRSLAAAIRGAPQANPQSDVPARSDDAELNRFLAAYATRFGVDAAALTDRMRAFRESSDQVARAATRQAMAQGDELLKLIGAGLQKTVEEPDAAVMRALEDHWWVQRFNGSTWVDLDPAGVADAAAGGRLTPSATLDPSALGDDLRHVVVIRVLIECACGNRLQERQVLEYPLRLSEVIGQPVSIQQIPYGDATPDPNLLKAANPGPALRRWLAERTEWMPILSVGSTRLVQSRFTRDGEVKSPSAPTTADAFGGLGDALGGGGEAPPDSGWLTAEMIDYEIRAPGRPVHTERRMLFDWIGEAARSRGESHAGLIKEWEEGVLDLATQTDILPLSAQPSAEFVADLMMRDVAANHDRMARALRDAALSPANEIQRPEDPVPPPPLDLYHYAMARLAFSSDRQRLYLAEPNIITRHSGFRADASAGIRPWTALDVVANTLEVLPGSRADAITARVRQGVLDTNLELLFSPPDAAATNIAQYMANQASPRQAWSVPSQSASPVLRRVLGAGAVVVTPTDAGAADAEKFGWWQVDGRTGTVLGFTRNGWGGTDEVVTLNKVNALAVMRMTGKFFAYLWCAYNAANLGITLAPDGWELAGSMAGTLACTIPALLSVGGVLVAGEAGRAISFAGDGWGLALSMFSKWALRLAITESE